MFRLQALPAAKNNLGEIIIRLDRLIVNANQKTHQVPVDNGFFHECKGSVTALQKVQEKLYHYQIFCWLSQKKMLAGLQEGFGKAQMLLKKHFTLGKCCAKNMRLFYFSRASWVMAL